MSPDFRASLAVLRQRIDIRLETALPAPLPGQGALGAALRDGILAPGKRLRPLMTAIVAEDLGGAVEPAIDAGCAVEMVHAASLVLDDLPSMDDATLRRGRPALHVAHGEDTAVLVAVAALAGASELIAGIRDLSAEARIESVAILSRAVGMRGLVGGQFEDLNGGRTRRSVARIAAANGLKTGALFSAAVEIGAVAAGADAGTRAELRRFAEELGHAFQIVDDLLDGAPDEGRLGKNVNQDRHKSTIVSTVGPEAARRRVERHAAAAHRSLAAVFGDGSRLRLLTDGVFAASLDGLAAAGLSLPTAAGATERQDLAFPEAQEIVAR